MCRKGKKHSLYKVLSYSVLCRLSLLSPTAANQLSDQFSALIFGEDGERTYNNVKITL